MIKLKLPGSNNTFVFNDLSTSKDVENEIKKVFYPYTFALNNEMRDIQWDIWIEKNDNNIRIKSYDNVWKTLESEEMASFEGYKKVYNIIRENLQLQSDYCYLHGAAILIDNQPCLFLSETGTGKSTISVYFDMQGHQCLSDDLIILNKKKYNIYSISKYAHIRKEGVFLFQDKINFFTYNKQIDRYEYLLSHQRFISEYQVKYIFILHRGHYNTKFCLCDNAFESILENMFLPYQIKSNIFSAIKISRDFNIYNVFYSDLSALAKELSDFMRLNFH